MGFFPKDLEILPPSDDRVFKRILTTPDVKPALIDLVSAIIEKPVKDVIIRNSEIPPEDNNEKAERLDVNVRTDDESQVDLEMQASSIEEDPGGEHLNLKGKSLYYLTDLHSSQPSKGIRRYDKLAKTYQVTFCSYTVFPNSPDYVNSFSFRNNKNYEQLSDALNVVFVELTKLKQIMAKDVSDMTDLEKWAIFFRYANESQFRETVNKVIESKEALKVAGSALMSISQDEVERAVYRSRRMFQTDLQSNLATAEDRGSKNKAIAIAKKMLIKGKPRDEILEFTELSPADLDKIVLS